MSDAEPPHHLEYEARPPRREWRIDIDPKAMREGAMWIAGYLLFVILFLWLL